MFLGLDNAGKTTILKAMDQEGATNIAPARGFNVKQITRDNVEFFRLNFCNSFKKVSQLTFDQKPQYAVLRGYSISLIAKYKCAFDFAYDWVVERGRRIFGTGCSTEG
jgi:hypothetical protein